jgi:hypothetical protein
MKWDLLVILLTIWNCLSIPFFFAFTVDESIVLEVVDNVIDVLFLLDMVFNFMTTHINVKTNIEIYDRK